MPEMILGEEINMHHTMLNLYTRIKSLLSRDDGQDLVEYGYVTAILALAAIAGMQAIATEVTLEFSNISGFLINAL
jgi:Flp pilus assembly pilin Flp